MDFRAFSTFIDLKREALALLREHFCFSCPQPHAVMLTGGQTPVPLYAALETDPPVVDAELRLLLTDERHVPLSADESNYGQMQGMILAMGLDDSRVMRVHTDLELEDAASRYHEELASFFNCGGRLTLGILGLGAAPF